MRDYLKIGELANMTGVTVRTLHHYDAIGLLKPIKKTDAGHRLYDLQSVTELYRIIAMKNLGFSLEEMEDLIQGKRVDVSDLIEHQISALQEKLAQKQLLLGKLLKLRENLNVDNVLEIIPFLMFSADQHLTDKQRETLKRRLARLESKEGSDKAWVVFITKLRHCQENSLPGTHPMAKECAQYWQQLTSSLFKEDKQMQESVSQFHTEQRDVQLRYGLTDELYKYLLKLME